MVNFTPKLRSIIILLILTIAACKSDKKTDDFPSIIEKGTLKAITSYSPVSYFIYRGQPMGYEYELLQMLGEHLGLKVDIIIAHDLEEMINMLERGEGDLIAYGLTITTDRREKLAFTDPLNVTHQVLVQKKPENWRQMKLHEIETQLVRNPFELAGKTVHVRRGSAYVSRLQNLSLEIGGEIEIIEAPANTTTEDLINLVANDSIQLTVADENIAQIQSAYYQDIDVSTPVSLPQQTAWAVRPSSKMLLDTINSWLREAQNHADYYVIYNKYYKNRQAFRSRYASEYNPVTGGAISPYDDFIKEGAEKLGWDWRMLAALIYRESQFNPNARSWAGASGLMQLMPPTAREFGASNPNNPEQNIRAGVEFLLWLDNYWQNEIENPEERLKFIIASYNVGHGHVQDARKLAENFGADPDIWHDHVERYMLKKSNPDYYNLDFVSFGYASGLEPVTYVQTIYELFEHYRKFID
ncbi:MAG: transporter substrate-binding domain-containing protein [Bacteroidales bacterium]|nr:transporter substrate-binding domain-containing protein [Bacteroidales bacterium]